MKTPSKAEVARWGIEWATERLRQRERRAEIRALAKKHGGAEAARMLNLSRARISKIVNSDN